MNPWRATKARRILAALLRTGWAIKRQTGVSHRVLSKLGWNDFVFSFHDSEETGPVMLKKISKQTGLSPSDL